MQTVDSIIPHQDKKFKHSNPKTLPNALVDGLKLICDRQGKTALSKVLRDEAFRREKLKVEERDLNL